MSKDKSSKQTKKNYKLTAWWKSKSIKALQKLYDSTHDPLVLESLNMEKSYFSHKISNRSTKIRNTYNLQDTDLLTTKYRIP